MADDLTYVGHMVDMAKTAQRLVQGIDRTVLDSDEKLQLALVRALQVIGEAAWRTSQRFKSAHSVIPWDKISVFGTASSTITLLSTTTSYGASRLPSCSR